MTISSKLWAYYKEYRQAIYDTIISMIPQIIGLITGFLTSILLARGLGKEKLGEYALIMSFYGIVTVFFDLGIGQTAIRFASKSAASEDYETQALVLRWAFRLRIFLIAIISFIAVLLAPWIATKVWNASHLIFLMQISLIIGALGAIASVPNIYFQSLKQFKMNTLVSTAQTVILFLGILFLEIFHLWKLEWVILATIFASLLTVLFFFFLVPIKIIFDYQEFKELVKNKMKGFFRLSFKKKIEYSEGEVKDFAFFIMISSIVVTLIMRADVWLMGIFVDKGEIGVYTAASKVTIPLTVLLGAINTALWPRASLLKTVEEVKKMIKNTLRITIFLFIGASFYSFFAPFLIPLVFGQVYASGIFVSQLLCFRYALALLFSSIGVIGYSLEMVKHYWWINLCQLGVVLAINIFFLPQIGIVAGAFSLIGNEVIGNLLMIKIIISKLKGGKNGK